MRGGGTVRGSSREPRRARAGQDIGIHVGDIIVDDDDIFGDGVNIAARLERIALPGGICISDDAQRQTRGMLDSPFEDRGPQTLKDIAEPMRAWRLSVDAKSAEYLSAVRSTGLDPHLFGTHSLRRTKATLIYRRTGDLRAVQLLLGHTKIESTVRYLGIEVDDALAIAEQAHV